MRREGPMSLEHKAKISAALKRYNQQPDAHLSKYQNSGPEHPNWKGGIRSPYYQRIAGLQPDSRCSECGSPERLVVHHIDENRRNSDPSNLRILCRGCHNRLHFRVRVEWVCACGAVLQLRPSEAKRRVYCSRECKEAHRGDDGRFH